MDWNEWVKGLELRPIETKPFLDQSKKEIAFITRLLSEPNLPDHLKKLCGAQMNRIRFGLNCLHHLNKCWENSNDSKH